VLPEVRHVPSTGQLRRRLRVASVDGIATLNHWDGSAWSTVHNPNPPQESFPSLVGAAAAASAIVFAVGQGGRSNGIGL
jgi:hypothetical protein